MYVQVLGKQEASVGSKKINVYVFCRLSQAPSIGSPEKMRQVKSLLWNILFGRNNQWGEVRDVFCFQEEFFSGCKVGGSSIFCTQRVGRLPAAGSEKPSPPGRSLLLLMAVILKRWKNIVTSSFYQLGDLFNKCETYISWS